jgi:amino acid adenylation domain-containing protein
MSDVASAEQLELPGAPVADRLRESVRRHADRVALVVGSDVTTFAQFDEQADRLAAVLRRRLGDLAGHRIGLLTRRDPVGYPGTFACARERAAFVPLNPMFPAAWLRQVVQRSRLSCILVSPENEAALSALPAPRPPVLRWPAGVWEVDGPGPDPTPAPGLAYLLFTSGSTGTPKGVPILGQNLVAFLDAVDQRLELGPEDRFSQTFEQTFDLSVFDLLVPWTHGAQVRAMAPADLLAPAGYVRREGVTVWFSVPSLAANVHHHGRLRAGSMPSLRVSLFCGEALPVDVARAWRAAAPASLLENWYGPTEATIACTAYRVPADGTLSAVNDVVSIGTAFPGVRQLVRPSGDGDASCQGELLLSGLQVFDGYWDDDVATDHAVVELSDPDGTRRRWYRTGDRVRRSQDGTLAYLGRTDEQVQVRGHRVELREVEASLATCLTLPRSRVVVSPVADASGLVQGLEAFIDAPDPTDGKALVMARTLLPAYMVPVRLVEVAAFPLNANDKIDRRALRTRRATR